MFDYIRDPQLIYDHSFEQIRSESDLSPFPDDIAPVAIRMVHACGMTDITREIRFSKDIVSATQRSLSAHKPIFCDCQMVMHGIIKKNLPENNQLMCTLANEAVINIAHRTNTTRSAAAVTLWQPLEGAVVVIGNAPTALFQLLELIANGAPRPAAIIAAPVGFVGAAESKQALTLNHQGIPFITLLGRRGGSAITAAALNAMAAGI